MEYKKAKTIQQKNDNYNGVGKKAFQFKDNRSSSISKSEQTSQLMGLDEEEEDMQLKADTAQKMGLDEEDEEFPIQQKKNNTGLPDGLKSGMENLSGMNLDHVQTHYNSPKPATMQAHAYAQGSTIHLASGQEKHLPHELAHVVQQAQGRVQATTSVNGMAVNDNVGLEKEADVMGSKALQFISNQPEAITESNLQEETNKSNQVGQFKVFKSIVKNNFSSQSGQNISKSNAAVQMVSRVQIPLLEALLYERILAYLTEQVPNAVAGEREEFAVMERTQAITWLRGEGTLEELDLNEAVDAGYGQFMDTANLSVALLQGNADEAQVQAEAAVDWMAQNTELQPGQYQLIDTTLSNGNCHGLTFMEEDNVFNPDAANLIENWHLINDAPIAVFFEGNTLMHSARLVGGNYEHTLPNGPKFNCDPETLLANSSYTNMFILPGQLEALLVFLAPIIAETAYQEQIGNMISSVYKALELEIEGAEALSERVFFLQDNAESDQREAIIEDYNKFMELHPEALVV
ncbi:MAG: DUF4157 domain-containing protein [Algibacter sp.]